MERAKQSINANFSSFGNPKATLDDLSKELDLTVLELDKDDYLKNCLYESLRLEPPVPISSSICLTET
jgi:cytochrome P450